MEKTLLLPTIFFVSPTKSYIMEIQSPSGYTLLNELSV
jgi:hypothetical protein